MFVFFFFKQKTAYDMRISDWSSDVCSSDLASSFGPEYIIPSPFDPRLMAIVPSAVAKAATDSGVAQRPVTDMAAYRTSLPAWLNPTTSVLTLSSDPESQNQQRDDFDPAQEAVVLLRAIQFLHA